MELYEQHLKKCRQKLNATIKIKTQIRDRVKTETKAEQFIPHANSDPFLWLNIFMHIRYVVNKFSKISKNFTEFLMNYLH